MTTCTPTINGTTHGSRTAAGAPAPESDLDLAALLAPVSLDDFLERHWDRACLHIPRSRPDYYRGLLSLANLEELMTFQEFAETDVRLYRESHKPISTARPVRTDDRHAELGTFYGECARGATIQVKKVQQRWAPVARLCRHLEQFFTAPLRGAAFYTPAHSQGILPHFSSGHAFILQLEGTKLWRVWDPVVPWPRYRDYDPLTSEDLGSPAKEVWLHPGDLLYCPRGFPHEARTESSASLHLTVVIDSAHWVDLLTAALSEASEQDPLLRQSLPPGLLLNDQAAPRAHFKALLHRLVDRADFTAALEQLASRFLNGLQPLPDGHLARLADVTAIGLGTVLRQRDGMVCRIFQADGGAQIQFPGNTVRGPASLLPALRFIVDTGEFAVRDLPGLSDDSKLVLARRLIKEGLLRPV